MTRLVQKAYFSEDVVKKSSHYHDCHQIVLILAGDVEFCVKNVNYQAHSGSLLIFSRYENHSVHVLSNEYKRYVLHLSPNTSGIENRIYSLLLNRPEGFYNAIDVSDQLADFEGMFCRIIGENDRQDALAEDMLQLLINELLIMIYRRLSDMQHLEDQNAGIVYALQRLFETNFHEQYTLEALAASYNISVSSLSHQFKKLTGFSAMEYLLSCRMASAKNYLIKTNLSIGEVVEKCGFSDCSNFCRTFKRLNGLSPSAFRQKYKAE